MIEWTDKDGQRAVINKGRLSIYGCPSMISDSGDVAVGVDVENILLLLERVKEEVVTWETTATPDRIAIKHICDIVNNPLATVESDTELRAEIKRLRKEVSDLEGELLDARDWPTV